MTITLNLPPDVEQVFQGEARARGLSLDEVLNEVILIRAEQVAGKSAVTADSLARFDWEEGIPVLRAGQPIEVSTVDETLDDIRRERERGILEPSN